MKNLLANTLFAALNYKTVGVLVRTNKDAKLFLDSINESKRQNPDCKVYIFCVKDIENKFRGYRIQTLISSIPEGEIDQKTMEECLIPLLSICYDATERMTIENKTGGKIQESLINKPKIVFVND